MGVLDESMRSKRIRFELRPDPGSLVPAGMKQCQAPPLTLGFVRLEDPNLHVAYDCDIWK